jgi:predicted nucleic acid-binding protein
LPNLPKKSVKKNIREKQKTQKYTDMKKKLRLYLDICTFNRPFDDQNQLKIRLETEAKLFIQQGILNDEYELVWSYILEYENNQNKFDDRRNVVYDWKSVAKICCVENARIIEYAENLKIKNIRTKDALHIACSVYTNSDYFITTDKQLFNLKLNDIKIINPLTFMNELEE